MKTIVVALPKGDVEMVVSDVVVEVRVPRLDGGADVYRETADRDKQGRVIFR